MHCLHWKCVASLINYVTTCCQYAVWEGVLCSDTSSCQQGTATSLGTNSAENRFPPQNCMSNVRFLRKSSNWQQTKGITKARLDKLVDIPKSLENGQTTSSSACIGCSFLRVLTMLIMYNNADKLIQTYLLTIHILFSFGHRWRVKWATRVSSPGISNGISCCPSNTAAAIGCGCTRTARRKKPCGLWSAPDELPKGNKIETGWPIMAHHGSPVASMPSLSKRPIASCDLLPLPDGWMWLAGLISLSSPTYSSSM